MKLNYLVISKDPRLPGAVKDVPYGEDGVVLWNMETFVQELGTEDGVEPTKIFINLDSITKTIYDFLKENEDAIQVEYYKFSDQDVELDFMITEEVIVYKIKSTNQEQPKPMQEQPIQENIPQQPVQEPVVKEEPLIQNNTPIETAVSNPVIENIPGLSVTDWERMMDTDDVDIKTRSTIEPARVILFGSSKGGTGKTFTCLLSAYRYAKTHPREKIAVADFDIIDGQVGITIATVTPTLLDYYKQYRAGNNTFKYLENCHVRSPHFGANIDFYLAPPMDRPEVTNDQTFWTNVFELLIKNYDVVFFDSGIDYIGKPPISKLYKIADKIILTCNTSVNSVKSIIRQILTLSGQRQNNVFKPEDKIASKVNVVLTRVSHDQNINNQVMNYITKYCPIIAAFGNMDTDISKSQWNQQWSIWDSKPQVLHYLDKIVE